MVDAGGAAMQPPTKKHGGRRDVLTDVTNTAVAIVAPLAKQNTRRTQKDAEKLNAREEKKAEEHKVSGNEHCGEVCALARRRL